MFNLKALLTRRHSGFRGLRVKLLEL